METGLLQDTASTIASWARFIAEGLESSGVDSLTLFRDVGIDLDEIQSPNQRFPVSQMTRVWQLAVERSGDPCFPLTLAERAHPDMYSALGLSIMFSSTLGEALNRVCRFNRIASDAAQLEIVDMPGGQVALRYQLLSEVAPQSIEAFMATGQRILGEISRGAFQPLAVHFEHDKPAPDRARYQAFFGAPVTFGADRYQTLLPVEALDARCYQANPELAANMENWMTGYLAQFDNRPLSGRVRRLLAEKLPEGQLRQTELASQLAMSTRALQRGLQKEGSNFKELLDLTRHDLALKYISEPHVSLIEICCLLGFSDQSNFTKAFKRWTGETPNHFRQSQFTG